MRDWTAFVRRNLRLPELTPEREARIVRELASQLEDFYRDALSRGLGESEADAHARAQVRNWEHLADQVQSADAAHASTRVQKMAGRAEESARRKGGRWNVLGDLMQDVRYALRQLRRSPAFTAVAVLTLALGIGANTAIYSMLHAVLLRPMPFPDSERIVILMENSKRRNNPYNMVSPANYTDWKERSTVFEHFAAYYFFNKILTGFELPERVSGLTVTEEFFPALGVTPLIGRFASPEELQQRAKTVVLSHRYWQTRFGGDAAILGKTLTLSGEPHVVTGVLPPEMGYPSRIEMWFPENFDAETRVARGRYLYTVGRFKPGVSMEQARSELDAIARVLEKEHPRFNTDYGISVFPLRDALVGNSTRNALLLLLATVGMVLLIACANVANLQLSRLTVRHRELAVRRALGASRFRMLRQLLTESLLLGLLGGLGGVGVALACMQVLPAMLPGSVRATFAISLDLPVLVFTFGASALAGVMFGVIPAIHSSRGDLQPALKEGGRTSTSGPQRLRNVLVVAEVALSLVLLIGAGLLVRSLMHLTRVDPGFDASGILTTFLSLPNGLGGQDSPRAPAQAAFYAQLLERIAAIPGVESVGAVNFLPVDSRAAGSSYILLDRPAPADGQAPVADIVAVAGDYFPTMRIPLVRGRLFNRRDVAGAPRAVIVNQALVREQWPNEDPIGKRLILPWDGPKDGEVVGVVGDVLQQGLSSAPRPTLYWAHPQFTYGFMNIVMRSRMEQAPLMAAVRKEAAALNPDLPLSFQTMDEVLSGSLAPSRTMIRVITLFAGLAIVLALIGLYGTIAYWVSQRTHEIGIRLALGAQPRTILGMILRKGAVLASLGIVTGAGGSVYLTKVLQSNLFGVTPTDPLTFGAAAALLAGMSLLACYVPARRATRVDPVVALRNE